MSFFSLAAFVPAKPVSGTIRVVKGGEEEFLSVPEFEAKTGVAFVPQLDFEDITLFQDVAKQSQKLHTKGELTREQIWQGSYYKNEILSLFFPEVSVRWIDDSFGWGIFAEKPFKKGECICEYAGKVRKRRKEDKKNAYCFEYLLAPSVPTPYIIDAQDQGGIGRFINHRTSDPNLRSALVTVDWISHVLLIADKPIEKGVQLVYDYGPDYWSCRPKPSELA